ncbi:hypothetical protein [Nitrosopumilus sp.]|uniref:hypothetical protein n=1 Tax=Nitrosopumilus sp. TaxID=2024843 RepID=UPI003B5AB559
MKLQHGMIITVGFLVSASLTLIVIQPDEIPHWNYLHEIKQQGFEDDSCDVSCKEEQENKRGYICVPLDSKQYICRPPRDIFYPDEVVQIRTAFPPTYGEFTYIPENHGAIKQTRFFDISNVSVVDEESKEILVEFKNHLNKDSGNYFEYSSVLHPGDTFVSHCMGGNSKMAHVVEYRDIIHMEGQRFIEFWGTHVDMPDELLPCKMPELIEQSLSVDLRLGISFVEENEN